MKNLKIGLAVLFALLLAVQVLAYERTVLIENFTNWG